MAILQEYTTKPHRSNLDGESLSAGFVARHATGDPAMIPFSEAKHAEDIVERSTQNKNQAYQRERTSIQRSLRQRASEVLHGESSFRRQESYSFGGTRLE